MTKYHTCIIGGCNNRVYSANICQSHRLEWEDAKKHRYRIAEANFPIMVDRIKQRSIKLNDCMTYTGPYIGVRVHEALVVMRGRPCRVQDVMSIQHNLPYTDRMDQLEIVCGNPLCWSKGHLRFILGTDPYLDVRNFVRYIVKGSGAREGAEHLSEEEKVKRVLELTRDSWIRRAMKKSGISLLTAWQIWREDDFTPEKRSAWAYELGLSENTIQSIHDGVRYKVVKRVQAELNRIFPSG